MFSVEIELIKHPKFRYINCFFFKTLYFHMLNTCLGVILQWLKSHAEDMFRNDFDYDKSYFLTLLKSLSNIP